MIICNFNTLIAERNLKITKIAKDTGISRTTLTSLANNYSQGIQFETLNTLCMYLGINPGDFFEYIPFDIIVSEDCEFDYVEYSFINIKLEKVTLFEKEEIKFYFKIKFNPKKYTIFLKLIKIECETSTSDFFTSLNIKILKFIEDEIELQFFGHFFYIFEPYLDDTNPEINFIFDWKC